MAWFRRCSVRVVVAVLFGGTFHAAWVALFISGASLGASGAARIALWIAAPLITAAGIATGLIVPIPGAFKLTRPFVRVFIAACIACGAGAVIMSPVGPMFVGLGVFGGGALAALALTVLDSTRSAGSCASGGIHHREEVQ